MKLKVVTTSQIISTVGALATLLVSLNDYLPQVEALGVKIPHALVLAIQIAGVVAMWLGRSVRANASGLPGVDPNVRVTAENVVNAPPEIRAAFDQAQAADTAPAPIDPTAPVDEQTRQKVGTIMPGVDKSIGGEP